jgi:hypothetical protein
MVQLVLNQSVVKFGSVDKVKGLAEVRHAGFADSELFPKAPQRGLAVGLAFALVAAAGVGPEQRGMVLGGCTLLKQGFALVVEQKDGKGTVKESALVGR